jgi:hypothetical protein
VVAVLFGVGLQFDMASDHVQGAAMHLHGSDGSWRDGVRKVT